MLSKDNITNTKEYDAEKELFGISLVGFLLFLHFIHQYNSIPLQLFLLHTKLAICARSEAINYE